MKNKEEHITIQLNRLRNELEGFINFFKQGFDYSKMVYPLWNAKDVLGHITFWHESFAKNISDLGKGIKPSPLNGKLAEVNKLSVETTKYETINTLIDRLRSAQRTIEEFINLETITMIPYKKGSRDYSRAEHLEVVANHINKHLKDLLKKYGNITLMKH